MLGGFSGSPGPHRLCVLQLLLPNPASRCTGIAHTPFIDDETGGCADQARTSADTHCELVKPPANHAMPNKPAMPGMVPKEPKPMRHACFVGGANRATMSVQYGRSYRIQTAAICAISSRPVAVHPPHTPHPSGKTDWSTGTPSNSLLTMTMRCCMVFAVLFGCGYCLPPTHVNDERACTIGQ